MSKQALVDAVKNRNLMVFTYRGKLRIVQPMSVEDTVDRHVVLKAREIAMPDIKSFRMDRMEGVVITPAVFGNVAKPDVPREGWTRAVVRYLQGTGVKVQYPEDGNLAWIEQVPFGVAAQVL